MLAVLLSACQVDLAVDVDVRDDGSGRVMAGVGLDDEALAQVGDLAQAVAADDLRNAGWEITGPLREADGLTWLRASKGFARPEEANLVLATLSGGDGPFRDLQVARRKSWRSTETEFRGRVDLTAGLGGLVDADLRAKLAEFGFDPGLDVEGLRRRLGPELDQKVRVQLSTRLPGKLQSNAPVLAGSRATWRAPIGQDTVMVADAELKTFRAARLVAVAAAGAGFVALALVVLTWRRRHRRHRAW